MELQEYIKLYAELSLTFSIQIVFMEAFFCGSLERKNPFCGRVLLAVSVFWAFSFAVYMVLWFSPDKFGTFLIISYFLIVWGMSMLCGAICFRTNYREMLFVGIGGYALQHIGFAVSTIIRTLVPYRFPTLVRFLLFEVLPFVAIGFGSYFAFIRSRDGSIEKYRAKGHTERDHRRDRERDPDIQQPHQNGRRRA